MEIWKDIKGYSGYQVGEIGVKSLKGVKERLLKVSNNPGGYPCVSLINGSKKSKKSKTVHRLIANHFIPNPKNKPCINHKNGIKSDFRIVNLEWCTHKENTQHAFKSGLHKSEKAIVRHAKNEKYLSEYPSMAEACRKTGVSTGHISEACSGKRKTAGGYIWKYK